MRSLLIALALIAIISPATAQDEPDGDLDFHCAKIKKTSDGFLALRRTPTVSAPLKVKLRTGWNITFDRKQSTADWVLVTYVGELDENKPIEAKHTRGWAHREHIKVVACAC